MSTLAPTLHESFLAYRRRRYLSAAVALVLVAWVAYVAHRPAGVPNGGTWLGYTLGTVGALLILWLMAFGIRKRSYGSNLGRVQGWLSAHVYLGTALLAVVTLHTGFQLGWNIHTLAFVLMCAVIASGIFGAAVYVLYPERMSEQRANSSRAEMLETAADLDGRALRLAAQMPQEFADTLASARDRSVVGGNAWTLLSGADRSLVMLPAADAGTSGTSGARGGSGGRATRLAAATGSGTQAQRQRMVRNADQQALVGWLTWRLSRSGDAELTPRIQELLALVNAKRFMLARLRRELALQAWLDVWRLLHVPISFGLLGALIAHVLAVFIYF
jgi:hypothetical protein